jgi:Kef-type K+ transport system membrane component KefB
VKVSSVFIVVVGGVLLGGGLIVSRGSATPTDELGWLALGLAILVAAALVGGHLAGRFGQAAVLGELLAGMLLGNLPGLDRLHFLATDPNVDIMARVGMILLLFEVGLDLSVRDLFAFGPSSLLVAAIGTAASLALGSGAAMLVMPGATTAARVFIGAAITATSVGITARVLKDLGASRSGEAKIILGAAVVDDVLALVVLGGVIGSIGAEHNATVAPAVAILALIMKTVGFLALVVLLGARFTPAWFRRAAMLQTRGALLAVGLCFCFFLAWAAAAIGLAALVGAFAAGLVLEDTHSQLFVQRGEPPLNELLQPMVSFLVPVFFVLVGFRTSLNVFTRPAMLLVPLALTVAAVAGKLACAGGVLNRGVKPLAVAVGMIPRGEVTLVFAALGATLDADGAPLLDERGYTALVVVVILTTLMTPPALKWSFRERAARSGVTRPAA